MRRRQFIAGLGSAAAWLMAARAQQGERVRRIGVLMEGYENDPWYKTGVSAFTQALAGLGWTDGRNVRMDLRWTGGDIINRIRVLAQELVGLQSDITCKTGPRRRSPSSGRRGRSRRQQHRRAARPPEWERHRLRRLGSLTGRQVARTAL